jgi:hypothetical protein
MQCVMDVMKTTSLMGVNFFARYRGRSLVKMSVVIDPGEPG